MAKVSTSNRIRFTAAEYVRMSDAGLFKMLGYRRTELIDGRIVRMAPQGRPHVSAVSSLTRLLIEATTREDHVVVQGTLYLGAYGALEPDLHVFDVPRQTPAADLPKPILIIEVSDNTYRRDSGSKLRVYAREGIDDYWIVNIRERRVEVYREPLNPSGHEGDWRYTSVTYFEPGQTVSMLKRPGVSFPVAEMLP